MFKTKTRTKKYRYLPTPEGGFVRKHRDEMTEKEKAFIEATKDLEGRNPDEIARYQDAAKELFS